MRYKIGFIGMGNIANAILIGFLDFGGVLPHDICMYDPDSSKTSPFRAHGITVLSDEAAVAAESNYVFLAVRPSDLTNVLERIAAVVSNDTVLVSVAAGISIAYIKSKISYLCKVIRIMPNAPIRIGLGATAISYEMPVTYRELAEVRDMFRSTGVVEIIPEDKMNEVISLNSSSPVYVYMLIRAMIDGAKNQGIDSQAARNLAVQTVLGAAKMVESSEDDISKMISDVCTPNGTTIQTVNSLEKRGFEQSVADAMLACTKRASQVESELK